MVILRGDYIIFFTVRRGLPSLFSFHTLSLICSLPFKVHLRQLIYLCDLSAGHSPILSPFLDPGYDFTLIFSVHF